ncbi:hypothetical protein [Virgibacillus necropolis]|nr:hypothetical protein [Virgibacillus necropolis]
MDKTNALSTYLVALALLERNGDTYVRREIRETMDLIKQELGTKK